MLCTFINAAAAPKVCNSVGNVTGDYLRSLWTAMRTPPCAGALGLLSLSARIRLCCGKWTSPSMISFVSHVSVKRHMSDMYWQLQVATIWRLSATYILWHLNIKTSSLVCSRTFRPTWISLPSFYNFRFLIFSCCRWIPESSAPFVEAAEFFPLVFPHKLVISKWIFVFLDYFGVHVPLLVFLTSHGLLSVTIIDCGRSLSETNFPIRRIPITVGVSLRNSMIPSTFFRSSKIVYAFYLLRVDRQFHLQTSIFFMEKKDFIYASTIDSVWCFGQVKIKITDTCLRTTIIN